MQEGRLRIKKQRNTNIAMLLIFFMSLEEDESYVLCVNLDLPLSALNSQT